MRNLGNTNISEKNKQENQPIYLYTIYDYDGAGNNLCLAQSDIDITYPTSGGVKYTAFPIKFDVIGENSQGEIDTLKITLCNVSRLIQSYLETYDWRGKKVKITLVWANQLADATAKTEDIFYIDNYTADELNVEATLSSKFDVLDLSIPCRKYLRNNCGWRQLGFKGTECGAQTGTTCNGTLQNCQALVNSSRYGGFPSVPTGRIYVG